MKVEILQYREYTKKTHCGFCTVSINGLKIRDCTHHRKDDREWFSFPSKSYEVDGQTKWTNILEWQDKADHWKFQEAAVAAVEEYLATNHNTGTDYTPF